MSGTAALLGVNNTVEVDRIGHRLALGVQWIDALSRLPAAGDLRTELESIGARPLAAAFAVHPQGRNAQVWAGRIRRLLTLAAAEKDATPPATPADDPTNFNLRTYARRDPRLTGYDIGNDARRYVPRRVALTPTLADGVPTVTKANIRQAWLWPGATYPLGSNATALRGRIRRIIGPQSAVPQPWARVIVTRPANPPDFTNEPRVGWGHGDDRGEFLVVLGFPAIPGGAVLPPTFTVRVWVLLPGMLSFDPTDPLASLPLEQGGDDFINDVLRGMEPPPVYGVQAPVDVTLKPGEIFIINDADLKFP